jgi:hypothetical protein
MWQGRDGVLVEGFPELPKVRDKCVVLWKIRCARTQQIQRVTYGMEQELSNAGAFC